MAHVPSGAFDAIARRAREPVEPIEPGWSWDAVGTFQPWHAGDAWLAPLTFGGDGPGVSLHPFGPGGTDVTRGSLEPGEPGEAVRAGVSLAAFTARLPVGTCKALGSWQPWRTPDELICTSAVAGVTFPSFLSTSPWEPGGAREAPTSSCSFQAEQKTVWAGRSWAPGGTPEPWLPIGSWGAGVQRGETTFSYEAFGSHLARQASLLIFVSDSRARPAWQTGVSWLPAGSWLPGGSWGSRLTSDTFGHGRMRGVGREAGGAWVAHFSLGSWQSVRALVSVQSSASFLSRQALLTVEAGGTPWSREAHDAFFSLQGDAYSPGFSLASFFTLILLWEKLVSRRGLLDVTVVWWNPAGSLQPHVSLFAFFSIKTKSSVAWLSFGSRGSRWSRSSWGSNRTHLSHGPRAAGRPLQADQSRLSRFPPVFVAVL